VRPVYETFRPTSDWRQDEDSHILTVYLPGFARNQIKVSTEGRNTLRVRGQRFVAGNKWVQFLEDHPIPQNGDALSVQAKFQGGVLTVSVAKSKPNPIPQN
ncbi:hypothetical protein M569_06866, partial [Genlisea aurea]